MTAAKSLAPASLVSSVTPPTRTRMVHGGRQQTPQKAKQVLMSAQINPEFISFDSKQHQYDFMLIVLHVSAQLQLFACTCTHYSPSLVPIACTLVCLEAA